MQSFTSDADVWRVVDLLIEETKQANLEGNSFHIPSAVMAQLSFFACSNIMLDKQAQKDIARYIYSKEFGISPYPGSYGDQPKVWIEKSFLIKNLIERQKAKVIKNG